MQKNIDKVILVSPADETIGEMDKVEAHRGQGSLHRAVSVFLFRNGRKISKDSESAASDQARSLESVEVLLQKRSTKKIVGASQWANTACGNVRPGESYQDCAARRLQEELGIIVSSENNFVLTPIHKFQYQVKCNAEFSENEIDQAFAGWYDDVVLPNLDEVAAYEWVSWHELVAEFAAADQEVGTGTALFSSSEPTKNWAPWFEIIMKKKEIVQKLSVY